MNQPLIQELIRKALAKEITFREILATLGKEGIESYHVDFLRDEFRYYATSGESFVTGAPLVHNEVAAEFSAESSNASIRKFSRGKRRIQIS